MEQWKVIGYRHTEFDSKDGNRICGTKLFLTRHRDHVVGEECTSLFVMPKCMDCPETDIPIGGTATITYNRYGKPDSVTFEF